MPVSKPLCALVLAAALASAAPAFSQDIDPGILDAQTGDWLVASEDGSPGCVLKLSKEQAIGGYSVAGAEQCKGSVAGIADAAAWNFDGNGGIILIDPIRKVLMRFIENEGFPLRTEESAGPVFDMVPVIKGVDRLPVAAAIKGEWLMKRPSGEILCKISLGDTRGEDENYPMKTAGACDTAVKKLDFSLWSASGLGITMMNTEGGSLSFVATPDGFDKAPEEGGKPLALVRP
ncbi:AprI/Inh family metalloprotease inhibitor [Pararhizobium sp.]|uniref:AprI/Inh family metalloprotease inhibitor n=1 Tax=Pararhizobium sp. TaxID=1977563 RepID=UPI002728B7B3|nr:AprI/Inh family metalloprotease inhibitor [Pararhizobium sp.]MDO9415844.1 AprI/Inh family metalloprotease inhibitor [Pararhizobium sp.]